MKFSITIPLLFTLLFLPLLTGCNNSNVSKTEAEQIALQHAGVSADDVSGLHTDYDMDDSLAKYEVKFYYGGQEYEYDIDAGNGNILQVDKDTDF